MQLDFSKPAPEAEVYPAEHSFRIITDSTVDVVTELSTVLSGYNVTSPLARGRSSSGGKYLVYGVSVMLTSRAEHTALDFAVKTVKGVRILL